MIKKALTITLIILAVLLLLAIVGGCILVDRWDFERVGDHIYYSPDDDYDTSFILGKGAMDDFFVQIGDNVYYTMNEQTGTAVIFGEGDMWDYEDYWGEDVLGDPRRFYRSPLRGMKMTKVIVCDGVTNLSFAILVGCNALQEIYLPDSIQEFDCDALLRCSELTNIYFEGDCPEFVWYGDYEARESGEVELTAPWNPLKSAGTQSPVTVCYQSGTTGWDPEFWKDYATLVKQKYEVDWSPVA